jgi:hypothetical protein
VTDQDFRTQFYKAPDKRPHEGAWAYWDRYEIKSGEGGRYLYAPRYYHEEGQLKKNKTRRYHPLVGRSGLFFKFARLADDGGLDPAGSFEELDTDKNAQAAYDWVDEWGALGLTMVEQNGRFYASTMGGEADTVAKFAEEAWTAHGILQLYEAATNEKQSPDVEAIAEILENTGMGARGVRFFTQTPEMAWEKALAVVADETQQRVARYCYPALYKKASRNHYMQGSDFANLLGALWLEMFWVLLSKKPRPCYNPECNRIVPYEPTPAREWLEKNDRSTGYATRADKIYCSRKCANRHYYVTVTKPRRQAAHNV